MQSLNSLKPLTSSPSIFDLVSMATESLNKKEDLRTLVEERLFDEAEKLAQGGTSRQKRMAQNAVAETLERNKTRIRLKNQLLQKNAMGIRASLKELGDAIRDFSNVPVDPGNQELSSSKAQLHDAEEVDLILKELLEEEENEAAKKAKSRLPRTGQKKNHVTVKKQKSASQENQEVKKTEKKIRKRSLSKRSASLKSTESEQKLTNFVLKILSDSFRMPQHPRIQRWKTKNVSKIRSFVDRDGQGGQILRYNELSDSEILIQRARHYLPGTERLLKDPFYRSIYAFQTNRGYGMACRLTYDKITHDGILYFGVGEDKTIFHKYFENKDFDTLDEAVFEDPEVRNSAQEVDIEDWESNKDFTLDVSQIGILTFGYADHMLEVFPLKKPLFDRMIGEGKK